MAGPSGHPLGQVVSEWRAGLGVRIGLAVVFALFPGAVPGAILLADGHGGQTAGYIMVAISVALIAFIFWQQSGVKVTIMTGGLERSGRFGKKQLPWDQLHSYQMVIPQNYYGTAGAARAGGLIGVLIAAIVIAIVKSAKSGSGAPVQSVVLHGGNGTKIAVARNMKDGDHLVRLLIDFADQRLFPLAMQDYMRGMPVAFGKRLQIQRGVGVTYTGVFGGPNLLPFAQVGAVGLEGSSFVVRKSDQKSFASLLVQQVPSCGVFQQIVMNESNALRAAGVGGQVPVAYTVPT